MRSKKENEAVEAEFKAQKIFACSESSWGGMETYERYKQSRVKGGGVGGKKLSYISSSA